jgi:NitT/TauT family transport system ATP-binding protein
MRADTARAEPCIVATSVRKVYRSAGGDIEAVAGIDFDVAEGEFISILGPSGCGKSTLLRLVAGLTPVTAGQIRVRGRSVTEPLTHVGMVFQRDVLFDWRSVLDNVLLTAEFRYGRRREWLARANELLDKLGLRAFAHRYPWELSGGMRQRVAICRALLDDPDLLLMDEPFGALDALTRDELNVELQRIWREARKTVVFVTHSIPEAVFLSDRVLVMSPHPGSIVGGFSIDLPRPRRLALRETAEFGRYSTQIRGLFGRFGMLKE